MASINMIAARRAENKRLEKHIRVMFLVVAGEAAITLALLSFLTACIYSVSQSTDQVSYKMKKIQPAVDQIDGYTKAVENLQPRLKLLSDSKEATLLWCSILQDLSRSMPEKTWLNGLATTEISLPAATPNEKPQTHTLVSLRGMADSQRSVGDTMLRLSRCQEFDKVDLNYTQKGNVAGTDTIEFDVSAALKQPAPAAGGMANNAKN